MKAPRAPLPYYLLLTALLCAGAYGLVIANHTTAAVLFGLLALLSLLSAIATEDA